MTGLVVLAGVAAALLAPLGVTAVRHRTLAAMALRNVDRRRSEALLVIGGAMLGTAIITSAFVVGDVVGASLRDAARTSLGPIDLTVTAPPDAAPGARDALADALLTADVDGVDGVLTTRTATATLEAEAAAATLPRVHVAELDVAAARAFGSDPSITGLADAPLLAPGDVLLNAVVADDLGVAAGDRVVLHAYGGSVGLRVVEVVPQVGIAGYAGAIVAPDTLAPPATAPTSDAAPPRDRVLVSLAGGVFDTRDASDAVADAVTAVVGGLPDTEVEASKALLLDAADREGAAFTELFGSLGVFSALAGVLLLVNLFVMLAEERKPELGTLRALGLTRRRLSRVFALEGALYALVASVLGALVGIAVGWVVAVAAEAFGFVDGGGAFRLVVDPISLGLGAAIGLVVSLVTIWLTSMRVARLTIVTAIRDLPEPRVARARGLVVGVVGVAAGAAVSLGGYLADEAVLLMTGVPVAAFSATPLLRRFVRDTVARLLAAGATLAWGLAAPPLFPDVMNYSHVSGFVVHVAVLTIGAVATAISLDRVWVRLAGVWPGRGALAVRLGVVYPRARAARTATLMGMFTLVVLTITLITAMSATFQRNTDRMVAQVAAGYDVRLDTSPANPADSRALQARADVAAVATLRLGPATVASHHLDDTPTRGIAAFDKRLVAIRAPGLLQRADAYATDEEAYRAVLQDPSLAIVPEGYLDTGGAESTVTPLAVGDTLTLTSPSGERSRTVTIVGMRDYDWAGDGAMVNAEVVDALLGPAAVGRAYVAAAEGVETEELARVLNHELRVHGAEAVTFAALGAAATAQDQDAMTLVRSFLALGLLIGIVAMSVVMVRAVRERRRALGVLRAIGAGAATVRTAMLSEAGLIAVQGTVIGVVLGTVAARQLLLFGGAFVDTGIVFVVPWMALGVILMVPIAAVLAATAWPASRAAATPPAVALRTAD